jgi:hypothetical protein
MVVSEAKQPRQGILAGWPWPLCGIARKVLNSCDSPWQWLKLLEFLQSLVLGFLARKKFVSNRSLLVVNEDCD